MRFPKVRRQATPHNSRRESVGALSRFPLARRLTIPRIFHRECAHPSIIHALKGPSKLARHDQTTTDNRPRPLEPVFGEPKRSPDRVRAADFRSGQQRPPTGSWGRGRESAQRAQFLLPFFCASKKGSRRKGETQSKENALCFNANVRVFRRARLRPAARRSLKRPCFAFRRFK
jgi:hypothetical protein